MSRKIFFLALVFLALGAPILASAHSGDKPIGLPFWGSPLLSCTAQDHESLRATNQAVTEICNDFCDILHTGQHLLYFAITILVFVIVPISFLVGGLMWIFSRGSSELVSKGTAMMKGAVIGLVVVIVAFVIVNTILTSIGRTENGPAVGWGTLQCSSTPAKP